MSRRMQRLAKRNERKTPPEWPRIRQCSRCEQLRTTKKAMRIHFREAHGFHCMWSQRCT